MYQGLAEGESCAGPPQLPWAMLGALRDRIFGQIQTTELNLSRWVTTIRQFYLSLIHI